MALTILNGPLAYGLTGVNLQYTNHNGETPAGVIVIKELDGAGLPTNNQLPAITATSVTPTSPGNGIVVFNMPARGNIACIDPGNYRMELT